MNQMKSEIWMDTGGLFGIAFLIAIVSLLLPIFANIFQNGRLLSQETAKRLKVKLSHQLETITKEDLKSMTKKQVFQLFQILPSVELDLLDMDYNAENLPQAVLYRLIQMITDHIFGPGKWIGKGFKRIDNKISGYNIFITDKNETKVARPFQVRLEESEIDGYSTTKLDYRGMNRGLIAGSMRDEVRMVNRNLLLGMGITTWGLGSRNPAHFILYPKD